MKKQYGIQKNIICGLCLTIIICLLASCSSVPDVAGIKYVEPEDSYGINDIKVLAEFNGAGEVRDHTTIHGSYLGSMIAMEARSDFFAKRGDIASLEQALDGLVFRKLSPPEGKRYIEHAKSVFEQTAKSVKEWSYYAKLSLTGFSQTPDNLFSLHIRISPDDGLCYIAVDEKWDAPIRSVYVLKDAAEVSRITEWFQSVLA